MDINYFKKINGTFNTNNQREIRINEEKQYILEDFQNSPAYYDVSIVSTTENRLQGVLIVEHQSFDKNDIRKKVITKPNEIIQTGEYIEWMNKHWLCTKIDPDNSVQIKGIISPCNNILKWQDEKTLEVFLYPAILQDKTLYSDGLKINQFITLADDQIAVIVQKNANIKKVKVDKRIMFNNDKDNVYKVVRIQDLIHDGLVYFIMARTEFNTAKDRTDLNLCDYVDIITPTPMEVNIIGSNRLKLNQTLSYTTDYPQIVTFELRAIDGVSSTDLAQIVSVDGNTCRIKGTNISKNVGKEFRLYATYSDGTNTYVGYLQIKMTNIY